MPVGEKQHHKGLVVSVGFQIFFQLPPAGPWCPRVHVSPVADGHSWYMGPVLLWGGAAAAAGSRESRNSSSAKAPCFTTCCLAG